MPALPAQAIGHTKLPGAVLVESDQYYREFLTIVLLSQGFAVYAFTDGPSLFCFLLPWPMPTLPCLLGLGKDARHDPTSCTAPARRQPAVVFLADEVIACEEPMPNTRRLARGRLHPESHDKQVLIKRLRRVVELASPGPRFG